MMTTCGTNPALNLIMIEIGDTLISSELFSEQFICDIATCHGACCQEGDGGAPVTSDEIPLIEAAIPSLTPILPTEALTVIKEQGVTYKDSDGDNLTTLMPTKECVFAYKKDGIWQCALETAYNAGKSPIRKPISCYLYPVRVKKHRKFTAVEYHKWNICKCACTNGINLKVPVYKFLRGPLIAAFGKEWYSELCKAAQSFYASDYYKKLSEK